MTKKQPSFSKNAKIFYLYFFIGILALCVFLFYQNISTKAAVNQFFKTSGLSQQDMSYKSVSKSLFGNSLIFYQVTFDSFNFVNHIEKLVLKKELGGLQVSIHNGEIDVIHSLRKTNNIHIIESLKEYTPITDLFQKPIQSLALSNIDRFLFNLTLFFTEEQNNTILKGQLTSDKLMNLSFNAKIVQETNSLNVKLKPIQVQLTDKGIFKQYDLYLKSLGYKKTDIERQPFNEKTLKWTDKNMPELYFAPTHKQISHTEKSF